jgi:uncharacterized membrane protein YkoI
MMTRRTLISLFIAAPLAFGSAMLVASDHDDAKRLKEAGDIQPLEQILAKARAEKPGRVLETELERKGERYIYEIEIVDNDGVVWELKFDAKSGELLKTKAEN